MVTTRDLYQCSKCRPQTSPIAGTIFASTHLSLRLWFRAIYHLTQTKQGISSIELGRRLGVTQTTAWKIKHKLKQAMLERDASKRLTGRIEIDDAYLGGERSGGKPGRGAPGKTPFVAAVETTTEGKPVRLKLRRVTNFCARSIAGSPSAASIQTALSSAMAFSVSPASQRPGACTRSARPGQDRRRLGRQPSNGSTRLSATSRLPSQEPTVPSTSKHVPRYLAEFEYRFNRRYDLAAMIPRLTWLATRTTPMPYRLLKLAELYT